MDGATRRTDPVVWVLVGVVAAVLALVLLLGGWGTSAGMMSGQGWGWAPLGMAGIVILVLLLIVFAARHDEALPPPAYPYPPAAQAPTALETLDARYARGEIPRDEYLRMREDLEHR